MLHEELGDIQCREGMRQRDKVTVLRELVDYYKYTVLTPEDGSPSTKSIETISQAEEGTSRGLYQSWISSSVGFSLLTHSTASNKLTNSSFQTHPRKRVA